MVARLFLFILCSLLSFSGLAQKSKKPPKPQVFVYGHGPDAFSAAMQAAQSGVQTYWVVDSTHIGGHLIQGETKHIRSNQGLDVGTWAFLLKAIANVQQLSDSALTAAKKNIAPKIAQNVFENSADTIKRLAYKKNLTVTKIEKSGKKWQVILSNGEKIKVNALVDATPHASLLRLLKAKNIEPKLQPKNLDKKIDYHSSLYRTGIAVAELDKQLFNIPLNSILPDSTLQNYFATATTDQLFSSGEANHTPLLMLRAQACGAAAAYCAFFNTSSDNMNVRTLQGELLAFKSFVMPFQDISLSDPHYPQVQRVGATGILKGVYTESDAKGAFLFRPDSLVSSKEIEPIVKQLYTRSQIWFKDKNIAVLKLKHLLDLIKYVANRGEELNAEVEKGWTRRFKFEGEYNLDATLSRRQFAVLVDTYLQPFHVRVNLKGEFQY
ncbi:FAD-dependent oxidoreductase [Olivibacter sp. XZL3]|uniref:FAD-dependent oxidoreductase n=1 Tax=Olivibacter sp. XZL3 TaxID=1735116 RepID=UPI0010671191|nr:FAD-dependent oxidoreductase [Olivibacter sp. XZL3]